MYSSDAISTLYILQDTLLLAMLWFYANSSVINFFRMND